MNRISKDLLAVLACPKCKSPVIETDNSIKCTNPLCGLVYPVREGIPIMLIEEATQPHDK
ncbi:MAG: Trm112 family protein [Lentisphaerae bacterium]|nr:Trm112 family protein [Lentisphaerota bacterium]